MGKHEKYEFDEWVAPSKNFSGISLASSLLLTLLMNI